MSNWNCERKRENMIQIQTNHVEETHALGIKLGELLTAGSVCTLAGELGVGKTTFTKGIGKGLGVTKNMNSPTFTIVKEYKGRLPLIHMDVYRMEDAEEDLGFDEYFYGEGVTIIEWAQMIREQLPEQRLDITIKRISDEVRIFLFEPKGEKYVQLCEELKG